MVLKNRNTLESRRRKKLGGTQGQQGGKKSWTTKRLPAADKKKDASLEAGG